MPEVLNRASSAFLSRKHSGPVKPWNDKNVVLLMNSLVIGINPSLRVNKDSARIFYKSGKAVFIVWFLLQLYMFFLTVVHKTFST